VMIERKARVRAARSPANVTPSSPAQRRPWRPMSTESLTSSRLLTVAAGLFRRKGYSATTTREIAALVGIKKASLYHHIAGKEDLLFDLCLECLGHIHTEVARAIAMETDPLERVKTFIRIHVTTMLADQDKHASMLIELRSLTGERRAEVTRMRDQYEAMLRAVIQHAQEQKAIRADIRTKMLALSLLNLLNWTIFWYEPDGGLSPDEISGIFEELFLKGARIRLIEGGELA